VEYEYVGDEVPLNPTVLSLEHIILKCVSDIFPGLAGLPGDLPNQGH